VVVSGTDNWCLHSLEFEHEGAGQMRLRLGFTVRCLAMAPTPPAILTCEACGAEFPHGRRIACVTMKTPICALIVGETFRRRSRLKRQTSSLFPGLDGAFEEPKARVFDLTAPLQTEFL
jgi:hypothetical protein